MAKYTGVNHVAFATADMDKTVRFWRDLLGMRLVAGHGKPGARQYFFEISQHDMISFFEWSEVKPLPEKDHGYPVRGPFGFDHVSIGLENPEDMWELKEHLDAAGFWVSEAIDHGFIHSIYSFDPNGIAIEFSCYVEGVDLREHPVMIDHKPSPVTLEGPDPQLDVWPDSKPTPDEWRRVYPGEGSELVTGKAGKW